MNIREMNILHTKFNCLYFLFRYSISICNVHDVFLHCLHVISGMFHLNNAYKNARYTEYAWKISFCFLIFCTLNGKISKQGGVILKNMVVILLTCFILVGMIGLRNAERDANRYEIETTLPIVKDVTETATLYGNVIEDGRKTLYANGKAYIETIYVAVGDLVSAGDPLMSLRAIDQNEQQALLYRDAEAWVNGLYRDGITNRENLQNEIQAVFNRIMLTQNNPVVEQNGEVYTLYSPIDGMVVSVAGASGDAITEYFPAVIVTDLNQLSVRADVSENTLKMIEMGDSCSVTVPALSGYSYTGNISFISPYAHEIDLLSGGGTYVTEVIIDVDHNGTVLRPGYQATVKVEIGVQKDVLMIPYDAVAQDNEGQEYVMVWTGKQAYRKDIVTGKEVDDFVQVLAGANKNQMIIRDVNQINFTERTVLYEAA